MLDFFSKDPAKIIEKCNKLRLEGKYDKAEQTLRKHIKNTKDDYLFLIELGKTQFEQEKLLEAVASFKSAYYQNASAIDKVIDVVEDIHYRSTSGKQYTGKLLIELYTKKRSSESIHKILKTLSRDEIEKISVDYKKKFNTVKKERGIGNLTKKDIDTFLIAGILAIDIKDFELADKSLTMVFKAQPSERNFILQEFMEATQYNYSDPEPFMTIGDLYIIMGDKDKAINYFQRAIKLQPELKDTVAAKLDDIVGDSQNLSETGKFSAADVYINKGDLAKAAMILSNLIDEDIKDIDGVISRLRKLSNKTDHNIETSRILIKALIKKGEFNDSVKLLGGILEKDAQQTDYILTIINSIEELDFDSEALKILKARTLAAQDETKQAGIIIRDLYKANPEISYDIEETVNFLLEKDGTNIDGLTVLASIFRDRAQLPKAKTLLGYISGIEGADYTELARSFYEQLSSKYPDDLELKLPLAIAHIKKNDLPKATYVIKDIVIKEPERFYDIAPSFFEPASGSEEIAKGILGILESIEDAGIDPYLYHFTLAEISYLAGNVEKSIEIINTLFEKFPEREEQLIGIVERMSDKHRGNQEIKEFRFKHHIRKKEYEKALEAVMAMFENKDMMGHVLDDLYLLHKHIPENYNVMISILKVLDSMGMYEKMIAEAKSFVEKVPQEQSGLIRFYIGKSYAKGGQVNDAATYMFQAITLDETMAQEAVEILKDLLKIDYSSMKLHYSLAHAYQKNNDIDSAIAELMEIVRIDEKQADIVIRDLEGFHETVKSNPKLLYSLGSLYIKQMKYNEGVERLKEAYQLDRSFMDPVLNLLKTMQEADNVESGEILFTMGSLYADKGMYKMASDHFYNAMSIETTLKGQVINKLQMIINQQPEEIYARYSLVQVYIDMHNYIQAIQLLRQIETINPSESENVISYYQSMLASEPNDTSLLLSMGDSYLNGGQKEKAIEIFRRAIKADKNLLDTVIDKLIDYPDKDLGIQFFLSDLYAEQGDYEAAVNWLNAIYLSDISEQEQIKSKLNRVLEQSPEQQNALMLLSNIYYNQESYEELIKLSFDIFEKSTVQEMKFRSGMLLSQAYRKTGNEERAEEIISRMIRENRMLYYTVLLQFYEQEKSSRVYKLQKYIAEHENDNNAKIQYASSLIEQKNYDEAKHILMFRTDDEELEFERVYYLSKISEADNNLIFALQIATNLRHSKDAKHISYLIKLLMKLGYHGEIDSILNDNPQYTVSMNRLNLSKNVFGEYKVLT